MKQVKLVAIDALLHLLWHGDVRERLDSVRRETRLHAISPLRVAFPCCRQANPYLTIPQAILMAATTVGYP
jgi:hypothetical protein